MKIQDFEVGEIAIATAGDYKCQVFQKVLLKSGDVSMFTVDENSSYFRTFSSIESDIPLMKLDEFEKSQQAEIVELTVAEISSRLGKTIKVVE